MYVITMPCMEGIRTIFKAIGNKKQKWVGVSYEMFRMDKKDYSIDSYIIIWNMSIILTNLLFGFIKRSKLRNINPLNVAPFFISYNPRERMFLVYISIFVVMFPSHVLWGLTLK